MTQLLKRLPFAESFITLAFPEHLPGHAQAAKCVDYLGQALKRRYPGCWFVWRMEPAKELSTRDIRKKSFSVGRPHLHLYGSLGDDHSGLDGFSAFITTKWADLIGYDTRDHPRRKLACCLVQPTEPGTKDKLTAYMAKYEPNVCNTQYAEFWELCGRRWGKFNAKAFQLAPVESYELTPGQARMLKQTVIARAEAKGCNKKYIERLNLSDDYLFYTAGDEQDELRAIIESGTRPASGLEDGYLSGVN